MQAEPITDPDSGITVSMEPSISTVKFDDLTSQQVVEVGQGDAENAVLLASPTAGEFSGRG